MKGFGDAVVEMKEELMMLRFKKRIRDGTGNVYEVDGSPSEKR